MHGRSWPCWSSGCDRLARRADHSAGRLWLLPHRMLRWCERHGVSYIVGLAGNQRLQRLIEADFAKVEQRFQATGEKQRHFIDLRYSAKSWGRRRAVIAKLEVTTQGRNPRFIVTNLNGDAQQLYDQVYCARGKMESLIKEQQLGLFADRTSVHQWWTNQFRLLLSSLAYVLMETIRRLALHDTELPMHRLARYGSSYSRSVRSSYAIRAGIRFLLSSAWPYQESLLRGRQAAGSRIALDECLPRHVDKQWGKGKVCLEFRKYPLHSPSSGLTTWLHPTIATQHNTAGG